MPDANPKAFELQAFVPYMMARVGALMAQSFAPPLRQAGITLQMWRVLMVVHFNGPLTLIDISRITGVKTSTLSRLVGRMIEKRLLTRRRSTQDARTVQITLRREGEVLFRELWPEAAGLEQLVTAPFTRRDVERFKAMLHEIDTILVRRLDGNGRTGQGRTGDARDDGPALTTG